MTKKKSDRVLIYYRVSSAAQAERYSIQRQMEMLPSFAQKRGWEVIGEFKDDGLSAKTIKKRPQALAFLKAIADLKPDRVLFIDPSRWLRPAPNDWEAISQIVTIGHKNKAIICTWTPQRKYFEVVDNRTRIELLTMVQAAGDENQEKGARVRQAQFVRLRSKKWPAADSPFGFTWNKESERFDPIPEEIEKLRWLFNSYAGGMTSAQICGKLNDEGFPTHRERTSNFRKSGVTKHKGRARWWSKTLMNILHREAYCTGEHVYDLSAKLARYRKQYDSGDYDEFGDMDESMLPEGGVVTFQLLVDGQPVISRELFDAVNGQIASVLRIPKGRRPKDAFLFRDWLRCGYCGSGIRVRRTKRRDGGVDLRYHCPRHEKYYANAQGVDLCRLPCIDSSTSDAGLWDDMLSMLANSGDILQRWLDEQRGEPDIDDLRVREAELAAGIAKLKGQRDKLVELFELEEVDLATYRKRKAGHDRELKQLAVEHGQVASRVTLFDAARKDVAEIEAELEQHKPWLSRLLVEGDLRTQLDALTMAEKKRFIQTILGNAKIDLFLVGVNERAERAEAAGRPWDDDRWVQERESLLDPNKDVGMGMVDDFLIDPRSILAALRDLSIVPMGVTPYTHARAGTQRTRATSATAPRTPSSGTWVV